MTKKPFYRIADVSVAEVYETTSRKVAMQRVAFLLSQGATKITVEYIYDFAVTDDDSLTLVEYDDGTLGYE